MNYEIKELTKILKDARKKNGLTQRAFAKSIDMPQSRLSNIENGKIDLQVSNLLELARSLDFDLMLIPRQMISLVNSLIKQSQNPDPKKEVTGLYDLGNIEDDND